MTHRPDWLMRRGWEQADTATTCRAVTYVTTSWDDGHVCDAAMAERLAAHRLPGTFYVAPENVELASCERLSPARLADLGQAFEIGGHTLTHRRLTTLDDESARGEIEDGKTALEDVLGGALRSFCYPGGAYGQRHVGMVRRAGFGCARTVVRGVVAPSAPFEMHTTVNAYRHLVDGPAVWRLAGADSRRAARLFWHWDLLAMELFDRTRRHGGVFHLWGHSWEIEQSGDWGRLERVFAHIAGHGDVTYVDNGELARRTGTVPAR